MAVLLEEAVEQLRERIEAGEPRLALQAPPGFGKTSVLAGLAASLANKRRVVRVELPEGDDAALVALVEAAAQLGGGTPDLLDRVVPRHEPARVPWASRLAALRETLASAGDDLLILLDGPRFQAPSGPEEELFARRAVEITEALLSARAGTIVLAGPSIPEIIARDAGVELPLVRDTESFRAYDAVLRLDGRLPRRLSPVVQQILLALDVAGRDVERIPRSALRLDRLVERDLAAVFLERPELRPVIARLSALRLPFSGDLLERAGFRALAPQSRSIVESLLHTFADGTSLMPAALSHAIRARIAMGDPAWTPDEPIDDAHRFVAQYHRERFEAARDHGDVATAIREELEEIHQLTEAGAAAELLARSLQFVEQYDALGKSLSLKALRAPRKQEEKLRRHAIRAYERAIEHDDRDAYAHHYIAYNLDILGAEPERVEREYVMARDLDREHPWYHSRYICFLITTAWIDEARAAWDEALVALGEANGALNPLHYEELHAEVARLLLERSQLDFADDVLDDVPKELRAAPWWRALDQLLICLEEDRDERLVFPPSLPLERRWKGPHLAEEREVRVWRPGRVLGRDEEEGVVLLNVARAQDELSPLYLSPAELQDEWNVSPKRLRVGTFVELIHYEDGTKEMKLWDRKSSSFDEVPDLPKLFPSPDRYIRHAFT